MEGPQLVVYAGGMVGGKTGQAVLEMQRIQAGTQYPVKVFQPKNAIRQGIDEGQGMLVSRSGPRINAILVAENNPREIVQNITRPDLFVLIDEAHMFTDPKGLKGVIEDLLDQRRIVHVVTLMTDYGARMFPITKYLLGRASQIHVHNGFCSEPGCTRPGNHSQLFRKGVIAPYEGGKLFTGDIQEGELQYKPRCLLHFEMPSNAVGYQEEVIRL